MAPQNKPSFRVLMLDNEFPPLGGGTGVVNYHLLQEFDALGIESDLVTSSRTVRSYEQERFGQHSRIFKVPVDNKNIHHSSNIELLWYTRRGLAQAYRLIKERPYQVCLAFSTVPAGAMALALRMRTGLPYVLSLQGPDVPGFEKRYAYLYPLLLPFIIATWRGAAQVTAISQLHRDLAQKTMAKLPIEIIPNGVDTSLFAPANANERRPQDPLVVICAGRLIERKGQHHLLQAISLLRERGHQGKVRAVFVGTGDLEAKLHEQCQALCLQDTVTFVGFRNREAMPELYQQADLFVLPSFNEGMSIALLEAMSSKLPVIVTDTGGTAELIKGNGLIVPWANPAALADAIEQFVRDPKLCEALGQRSREIVQDFSWEAAAAAHLTLCFQAARQTAWERAYARVPG